MYIKEDILYSLNNISIKLSVLDSSDFCFIGAYGYFWEMLRYGQFFYLLKQLRWRHVLQIEWVFKFKSVMLEYIFGVNWVIILKI